MDAVTVGAGSVHPLTVEPKLQQRAQSAYGLVQRVSVTVPRLKRTPRFEGRGFENG